MSFNPKRLEGNAHRVRRQDPHSGRKHSDIMNKGGPRATSLVDMSRKENTSDGWRIPIFDGPDFDVCYRYICAKNSSGMIKNNNKDRVIRVLAGRLYVNINGDIQELTATQSIALERGVVYEMATSGTEDAELIVCQGHHYTKDLEIISPPSAVSVIQKAAFPEAAPHVIKRSESIAQVQAAQLGAAREEKRKAARTPVQRVPLPGQQVVGINPRPSGAAGFNED